MLKLEVVLHDGTVVYTEEAKETLAEYRRLKKVGYRKMMDIWDDKDYTPSQTFPGSMLKYQITGNSEIMELTFAEDHDL